MAVEWEAVAAVGEWIGALATIGGFYYVGRQLSQERVALHTQTASHVYQVGMEVLKVFIESPDLRRYFYEKDVAPPQDPESRSKVMVAAEMIADHFENIYLNTGSMADDASDVWMIYMTRLYDNSPSFRTFMDEECRRYSISFLEKLDPELAVKCRALREAAARDNRGIQS